MRDSLIIAVLAALALGAPALADTGPCKPFPPREILLCGNGDGAAIVIDGTTSPDKKFALGWRDPKASPLVEPDGAVELVFLRLSDGKILARSTTEYWFTGEARSNHPSESAWWSPDSRYLIRSFSYRYGSDMLELYAVGKDAEIAGPIDLLKVLDAPLRAKLKPRLKNMEPDALTFIIGRKDDEDKPAVQIDARGHVRMDVMFWRMKNGPTHYFTVNFRIAPGKDGPVAKIVSVGYQGMDAADE